MKLTLIDKKQETKDVSSFIFESRTPMHWVAGQYLFYTLPHENPDQRGVIRYFTISSAPFENHISITTKLDNAHPSSFKKTLWKMRIGESIEATDPDGDFIVGNPKSNYVFISGGIGITPYRSILLDLDHRHLPINATLLYANHDDNFVFKNELEEILKRHSNFKIKYFVSPKHIEKTDIQQAIDEIGDEPIVYFSGPEPMTEAFEKTFKEMGLPTSRIKLDFFPGYDPIK